MPPCSKGKSKLADTIINARRTMGMSQYDLAAHSGISRPTISNIERGAHSDLQISTAAALAKVLGLSVSRLTSDACHSEDATEMIEKFLASDWARVTKVTEEEREWLLSLPQILWLGKRPTDKTFHLLVEALRETREP